MSFDNCNVLLKQQSRKHLNSSVVIMVNSGILLGQHQKQLLLLCICKSLKSADLFFVGQKEQIAIEKHK